MFSIQDTFLLAATFDDVEDPCESFALLLHVWSNMLAVYLGSLGDKADTLWGVLLDMLFSTRKDDSELQICWLRIRERRIA